MNLGVLRAVSVLRTRVREDAEGIVKVRSKCTLECSEQYSRYAPVRARTPEVLHKLGANEPWSALSSTLTTHPCVRGRR